MAELEGFDLDGVLTAMNGIQLPVGAIVISGRTWAEYDDTARMIATQIPVYIRGTGAYGDHLHAGIFKAAMINFLGVTVFHEDHPQQVEIIKRLCPQVKIVLYGRAKATEHPTITDHVGMFYTVGSVGYSEGLCAECGAPIGRHTETGHYTATESASETASESSSEPISELAETSSPE